MIQHKEELVIFTANKPSIKIMTSLNKQIIVAIITMAALNSAFISVIVFSEKISIGAIFYGLSSMVMASIVGWFYWQKRKTVSQIIFDEANKQFSLIMKGQLHQIKYADIIALYRKYFSYQKSSRISWTNNYVIKYFDEMGNYQRVVIPALILTQAEMVTYHYCFGILIQQINHQIVQKCLNNAQGNKLEDLQHELIISNYQTKQLQINTGTLLKQQYQYNFTEIVKISLIPNSNENGIDLSIELTNGQTKMLKLSSMQDEQYIIFVLQRLQLKKAIPLNICENIRYTWQTTNNYNYESFWLGKFV